MFYMRLPLLALLVALPAVCVPPANVLQRYSGTWQISRKSAPDKKEELKNQCASVGDYYACQQSNNGAVSGLLVFTPSAQPSRFNTQNVMPDGRATGKGELMIDGDTWVFTSSWNGGGTLTRYRTTNTFAGPDRIQFQQEESTDGTHWQMKDSGVEIRTRR